MNGYKEFWNKVFYGSDQGFAGTSDVTEYWLRIAVIVAVCLLAGVASQRFGWIPGAVTALFIGVWALSVGPFIVRAASCGGCGSASSYDTARSYEAMLINQAWGGMLAMAIAAVWVGAWLARRIR